LVEIVVSEGVGIPFGLSSATEAEAGVATHRINYNDCPADLEVLRLGREEGLRL